MNNRVFILGLLLACVHVATADASLIPSWSLQLSVRDSTTDTALVVDNTVALPFLVRRTASTLGGTESTALYDFIVNGDTWLFHFKFNHYRSGVIDSQNIASGDILFQV